MEMALKTALTVIFVAFLCFAITHTNNESWLTAWFLLFFFAGVPLSLLVLKDLLAVVVSRWIGSSQLLLHVCAMPNLRVKCDKHPAAYGVIFGFSDY
jgi:hypothetical protein